MSESNTRAEAIEVIKGAVAKVPSEGGLSRVGDWFTDATLESVANSVLDHLESSGRAVVPREPTNEMLVAALGRALEWMKENGVTGLSPFCDYPSPTETTRQVYRAMLAAALPPRSE